MKTSVSLFIPILFAMLMLTGASSAKAADVHFSIGGGNNNGYRYHNYTTSDPVYSTWYPDSTSSYGYDNGYYGNNYSSGYYTAPYVYTTPSVGFSSWYGNGYQNHNSNYNYGHGGYSGGYRSSNSGGNHGGGGSHRK